MNSLKVFTLRLMRLVFVFLLCHASLAQALSDDQQLAVVPKSARAMTPEQTAVYRREVVDMMKPNLPRKIEGVGTIKEMREAGDALVLVMQIDMLLGNADRAMIQEGFTKKYCASSSFANFVGKGIAVEVEVEAKDGKLTVRLDKQSCAAYLAPPLTIAKLKADIVQNVARAKRLMPFKFADLGMMTDIVYTDNKLVYEVDSELDLDAAFVKKHEKVFHQAVCVDPFVATVTANNIVVIYNLNRPGKPPTPITMNNKACASYY